MNTETEKTKHAYPGKDLEAMSFAVNYSQWILEEIRPYLHGRTAEIGAGIGNFSRLLLSTQIERLECYEPCETLFPLLQEAIQDDSRAHAVNDFFAPHSVEGALDSVVYINVLEHIENDLQELKFVNEVLSPKGNLIVFVPALSWLFSNLDREVGHFRRYHKTPLQQLVNASGLTVKSVKYFDFAGIVPWYLSFVLLGNSIGKNKVSAYDRFVVPLMKPLEKCLPPPIGKNLLLIAGKS